MATYENMHITKEENKHLSASHSVRIDLRRRVGGVVRPTALSFELAECTVIEGPYG
jgi:hypothetical protein